MDNRTYLSSYFEINSTVYWTAGEVKLKKKTKVNKKGKVNGMAMEDWDGDGKKDMMDDMIEYQLYKNFSDENSGNAGRARSNSGGNMSTLGAILCTVSGLVWQALIYTIFDIKVDDVPTLLIIFLWFLFSFITAVVVEVVKG